MTATQARGDMAPLSLTTLMPLLFVVLWSSGFIGAKLGLPYAEPMTLLALRFAIVAAPDFGRRAVETPSDEP